MAVPKIRFPGFTEDWEQRKLGELGTTYTGISGKTSSDFGHGDARFITYMNVYSNAIANPLMVEPIEIDQKQNEVKVGDVFFTTSSETPDEVGMSSVLLEKQGTVYLNSFCFGYRPKEKIDLHYLAFMLRSEVVRKKIIFLAQGISRYNISKNKMMEISVPLPTIEEQSKIGGFLNNLDNLITLHQRKLESMKLLKKSLLQKMFPKSGETVPEVRFPGFTDAWEQRKFSEVFYSIPNNTLSRSELSTDEGTVKNIHYGDVLINFDAYIDVQNAVLPRIVNDAKATKAAKSTLKDGDVVIADTAEDETVGKCAEIGNLVNDVVVSGLHTIPSRPKFKFGKGYLGFYMNSSAYHDQLRPLIQGIKVSSISKSALAKTELKYPKNMAEQEKIGSFFLMIDNTITLHQRKVEILHKLKKSLLQQMFV